ncbi:MAG: MFS transporter [Clostridia bacterium]|nr:MFS transporter [Clostridia bacterium]
MIRPLETIRRRLRPDSDFVAGYGTHMDRKTRSDLDLAIFAVCVGALFPVITGFPGASPVFTAYLKELGLNDRQYGAILTIPQLTILIQIPFSVYLGKHGGIKRLSILSWLLLKPLFILLGVVPLFAGGLSPLAAILLASAVMFVGSSLLWIGDIGLNTWFGALIPPACKGQFFGMRQRMVTLFNVGFALLLAAILPKLAGNPYKYTILFTLAAVSGIADALTYLRIRPPENAYQPMDRSRLRPVRLASFLEPIRDRNYRPFLLFSIVWYFSLNIAGPYFNVYMLNTLGVTLGQQTFFTQIVPGLATFLFISRMGRMNDRYGNRPVLLLSCAVVCLTPLIWLFVTPDTLFLIALVNITGGIFVTTVDLSVMNMAIFFASAEKRSVYLSVRSISTILVGVVPAMLIGGVLSDWLTPLLEGRGIPFLLGQELNAFHILLIISLLLRLAGTFVFARRIREPEAKSMRIMTAGLLSGGRDGLRRFRILAFQFATYFRNRFPARRNNP